MKNTFIYSLAIAIIFSGPMAVSANERGFDTIDNAPEEKERGISPEQWERLTNVLRDTPNGDKVMRILKKRLPRAID